MLLTMGYGDALIAAGQAQEIFAADPARGPICVCASDGRLRWNPVWLHNPAIATAYDPTLRRVITGKGHLPYLHSPYSIDTGWRWTDWHVRDHRPTLYLTPGERALAPRVPFVLLEPTAARKHPNRRPDRAFWPALLTAIQQRLDLPIVQLVHAEAEYLPGCIAVHNASFRDACGVLSGAACLVTTEGGLPHAAAALRVPAVVLFGGCISVDNLGYPEHVNFGGADACGRLLACAHCRAIWQALSPVSVADAVINEVTRGVHRSVVGTDGRDSGTVADPLP